MIRNFVHVDDIYAYTGSLPTGCIYCIRGTKIVIFVTGLCDDKCFYCPVSQHKLGYDVVYVDEEKASTISDIINEAFRVGAEGASITGGDPLLRPSRTIRIIRNLKEVFGDKFHIHLYTSGRYATASILRELEDAGLDEIRFHPTEEWLYDKIRTAIAVRNNMSVGVEIPILPDKVDKIKELILWLDNMGVDFINLNELEVSESNIVRLRIRNYDIVIGRSVVKGSYSAGLELVKWARKNTKRVSVHFCPARYKDMVQMRNRMIRKSIRIHTWFEEPTPQGTLRVGVVNAKLCRKVVCGPCIDSKCITHPRMANLFDGDVLEISPSTNRFIQLERLLRKV